MLSQIDFQSNDSFYFMAISLHLPNLPELQTTYQGRCVVSFIFSPSSHYQNQRNHQGVKHSSKVIEKCKDKSCSDKRFGNKAQARLDQVFMNLQTLDLLYKIAQGFVQINPIILIINLYWLISIRLLLKL